MRLRELNEATVCIGNSVIYQATYLLFREQNDFSNLTPKRIEDNIQMPITEASASISSLVYHFNFSAKLLICKII
jgi:hypothetical protein